MEHVMRRRAGPDDRWVIVLVAAPAVLAVTYVGSRRPGLALLALVGLVVAVAAVVWVQVALYLLLATVPLEGVVAVPGSSLTLPKVVGLLALVSLAFWVVSGRHALHLDRLHGILFLLLGLAMVSTLQARSVDRAADVTLRYAGFVILSVLVSQVVTNHAVAMRLIWVLSLAAAATSVLALDRYFSGEAFAASVPFHTPGDFAYIVATTLPLTLLLFDGSWARRALVAAVVAVMFAGVVLSFSRGALLGLAAGLVWHVVTHPRHRKALLVMALAGGVITYGFISSNQSHFEQSIEFKSKVAQENVDNRVLLWRSASRLAADHPLLGVGPGNFSERFYEVTDNPLGVRNLLVVHNAFLDVAAELGIVALGLFLLYLATAFVRLSTAVRAGVGPPGFPAAVRTALIVAVVAALTMSEQFFAPIWMLGGLTSPLWRQATAAEEAVPA